MPKDTVFLKSPTTGEIREVEPTPEALTPLMAAGWHQTVAPAPVPALVKQEAK